MMGLLRYQYVTLRSVDEAPFTKFHKNCTKLMTNSLVKGGIYWLNVFPGNNVVSSTIWPAEIFLGRPQPDFNRKRISFGSYSIASTKTKNDTN